MAFSSVFNRIRAFRLQFSARALPAAVRRYLVFAAKFFGIRRTSPTTVILIGLFKWFPSLHLHGYICDYFRRRQQTVAAAFCFAPADHAARLLYAGIGAPLSLTLRETKSDRVQAEAILHGIREKWDLVQLSIDGILVGDLIYDTYLRERGVATIDTQDSRLLDLIARTVGIIRESKEFLLRHHVPALFVDHTVYIYCGVLLRVVAAAGIPAFLTFYNPRVCVLPLFRDGEGRTVWRPYPFYRKVFSTLSPAEQDAGRASAREELEARLSGTVNRRILRDTAYGAISSERLMAETGRPRILIFLHDFCDAVHIYRWLLFPDFLEWITWLLAEAAKTPYDWYVKPHPNIEVEQRESLARMNEEIINCLKEQFPKAHFLSPRASNLQLVQEGLDAAFTVHGNAAHEFAYQGIPVVNAGDNPHVEYDFNFHPKTIGQYAEYVRKAGELKLAINKEEIEEFAFMHNTYFWEKYASSEPLLERPGMPFADLEHRGLDYGLLDDLAKGCSAGHRERLERELDRLLSDKLPVSS